MLKFLKITISVLIIIVVVSIVGAYYSGKKLAEILPTQIDKVNLALSQPPFNNEKFKLELQSLDSGILTSTAVYKFSFNFDKPEEITIVDQIEHGPFPWSRLSRLKLLPVMFASSSWLEPNELLKPWFNLTNNKSPVIAKTTMDYSNNIQMKLQLLPIKTEQFDFSGLNITSFGNMDSKQAEYKGQLANLNFGDEKGKFAINGFNFEGTVKQSQQAPEIYLGDGKYNIDSINIQSMGQNVALNNFSITSDIGEKDANLHGKAEYNIKEILLNNKLLAKFKLALSVNNFSIAAYKKLQEGYLQAVSHPDEKLIKEIILQVFESKPQVNLDDLSIITANSAIKAQAMLQAKAPAKDVELDNAGFTDLVDKVKFDVTLPIAALKDIITVGMGASMGGSINDKMVKAMVDSTISGIVEQAKIIRLAKVSDQDISSKVDYTEGDSITINGAKYKLDSKELAEILPFLAKHEDVEKQLAEEPLSTHDVQ